MHHLKYLKYLPKKHNHIRTTCNSFNNFDASNIISAKHNVEYETEAKATEKLKIHNDEGDRAFPVFLLSCATLCHKMLSSGLIKQKKTSDRRCFPPHAWSCCWDGAAWVTDFCILTSWRSNGGFCHSKPVCSVER